MWSCIEKNENFSLFLQGKIEVMAELNRLKVVLVEKKKTSKWLAETLEVNPTTVSKWCTNSSQPDLGNLMRIANVLKVDVNELLRFQFIEEMKKGGHRDV